MNKKELVKQIGLKTGFSQKDVMEVVDCMLDIIIEALKEDEEVNLTGFGKFVSQKRNARVCRNPRTNEEVQVGATRVPKFKAGKAFKEAIAI